MAITGPSRDNRTRRATHSWTAGPNTIATGWEASATGPTHDWPYDLDGAHLFPNPERKLVQLAERLGLPLAYQTSMDLAAYPRCSDASWALAGEHGLPGVPACMITERCHHARQP